MEQAKARNPNIKLYGLAWAAPGWISGGFWSTDTINYLISWLGCAKQHGLTIDYLGGWNERGHDVNWYIQLRSALNAAGYGSVQIVGDDSGWGVADDMATNSAFNNAVSDHRRALPLPGRRRRQRRHLLQHRHREEQRQAAVGQRERLAGHEQRRAAR